MPSQPLPDRSRGLCRTIAVLGLGLGLGLCWGAMPGHAAHAAGLACDASQHGAAAASAASATERIAVWVDLSLPVPTAAISGLPNTTAQTMRQAVQAQQQDLAAQLGALGATELARVVLVRNAMAVELPASAVPLLQQLPGVLRVRPITHRNRVDPPQRLSAPKTSPEP